MDAESSTRNTYFALVSLRFLVLGKGREGEGELRDLAHANDLIAALLVMEVVSILSLLSYVLLSIAMLCSEIDIQAKILVRAFRAWDVVSNHGNLILL